jgi:HEAT repeat protein
MHRARGSHLVATLVFAALAFVLVAAQGYDPVEELRQTLPRDDVPNPTDAMKQFRRDTLGQRINELKTISELRRALALTEWRDDPLRPAVDPDVRRIDAEMRRQVALRLTKKLEHEAKNPNPTTRHAVANLIAEIGPTIRGLGEDMGGYARTLTPLVVTLAGDRDIGVRQEALRALGTINAKPQEATKTIEKVLQSDPAVGPRRVAAASLGQLVTVVTHLQKPGPTASHVKATVTEVLDAAVAVIRTAPVALADADPHVRRSGMEALTIATQVVSDFIDDAYAKADFAPPGRPLTEKEAADVAVKYELARRMLRRIRPGDAFGPPKEDESPRPALAALNGQGEALARALRDPDPGVRLAAARTLLEATRARQRVRQLAFSLPALPVQKLDPSQLVVGADPLENFLDRHLGAVAPLFHESDVQTRKLAGYALVLVEDRAAPLAEVLNANLTDPERSVRWAAVRALQNLPADKVVPAVPNLAKLLRDEDFELRKLAADTLAGLGSAASPATPALAEAITFGDALSRIAALDALLAQGPANAAKALPQMIATLQQPDAETKVLVKVAQTLGKIGAAAQPAVPHLRRLIGHAEGEVRTAASEAILAITGDEP